MPPQPGAAAAGVPAPASGGAPPDVHEQVRYDQLASMYRVTPEPVLAGMVCAVLMVVLVWGQVPGPLVLSWFAFKCAMAVARLLRVRHFKHDPQSPARVGYWTAEFLGLVVLDTLGWAAMPILFMPFTDPAVDTALFATALAVAAVGVFTTFHHFGTGLSYLVALLGPIGLDQLVNHGTVGLYTALGLLLYIAVLAFEVRRGEARMIETLRLRYENAWIAEQRARALALAEQSSAGKTRFLAAVSHEIRTPLNGIFGMTQLLRETVIGAQARHQLDVVQRSARHLQTVIGDLLDLSRIEFGRLKLENEPFAVVDAVHEVTDLLGPAAAEKGLALHVTFAGNLPRCCRGDVVRIRQVLHNLVGNAIKFTLPSDRRGAVIVSTAMPGPGCLRFTVQDTGEGIAADQIERIFDAFEQAGDPASGGRAGTGLGLTISRQLARAMGGDVACRSILGEGTTFVFTVAVEPAADDAAGPGRVTDPAHAPLGGHVLVVDDNPVNALVASSMLALLGVRCDVADSGEQALERLAARRYDAVLMDCLMPGLDGLETTRRWREREVHVRAAPVPIIALTASAVIGDREKCLAAGMDDYLAKPFERDDLMSVLRPHLLTSGR